MRISSTFSLLVLLHWPYASAAVPPSGTLPPSVASAKVPFRSFDAAIAEARKGGGSRIFVFLEQKDCGDCRRMDALIFPARAFQQYLEDKVVARLDIDAADGAPLAARFGITPAPAWLVLTPDLVVSSVQVGVTSQAQWFDELEAYEKRWATYQKMLAEEARSPRDGSLIFENARETFKRRGDALAEPKFRKLADDASTPPAIREQSLAYLATIEMDAKRLDDARRDLERLLESGKDADLLERAEIRLAEVEIGKGDYAATRRRLQAFRKAHPSSKLLPEVQELEKLMDSLPKTPTGSKE